MNFGDVKARCHGRWEGILIACGVPEGLVSGKNQPCPFCKGTDRFRFTDHEGDGWYFCNQCGRGDGLDFLSKFKVVSVGEACEAALLAIGQAALPRTRSALNRNFGAGSHPIRKNDPAALYLGSRGLKRCSPMIRFNPGIWDGCSRKRLPAMIAAISNQTGNLVGWHATFLERNGKEWHKAKIEKPKRQAKTSSATISGGAVRLLDPVAGMIAVAEGIETSLAVTQLFGIPCWSLMNTSCVKTFKPPDGIREVRIFADTDENFRGQEAAYRLASRLHSEGFRVRVQMPIFNGDYLDVLNSKRLDGIDLP
ncbi:MAG: toprim domain-containing protein [Gammaproteobacteria bacterium]